MNNINTNSEDRIEYNDMPIVSTYASEEYANAFSEITMRVDAYLEHVQTIN